MSGQPPVNVTRLDDDPERPEVPQPIGPEPKEPDDNRTLSSPINELESRLLGQRKVLVFGAITDKVARDADQPPLSGPGTILVEHGGWRC